jgi:hypothetical protein
MQLMHIKAGFPSKKGGLTMGTICCLTLKHALIYNNVDFFVGSGERGKLFQQQAQSFIGVTFKTPMHRTERTRYGPENGFLPAHTHLDLSHVTDICSDNNIFTFDTLNVCLV